MFAQGNRANRFNQLTNFDSSFEEENNFKKSTSCIKITKVPDPNLSTTNYFNESVEHLSKIEETNIHDHKKFSNSNSSSRRSSISKIDNTIDSPNHIEYQQDDDNHDEEMDYQIVDDYEENYPSQMESTDQTELNNDQEQQYEQRQSDTATMSNKSVALSIDKNNFSTGFNISQDPYSKSTMEYEHMLDSIDHEQKYYTELSKAFKFINPNMNCVKSCISYMYFMHYVMEYTMESIDFKQDSPLVNLLQISTRETTEKIQDEQIKQTEEMMIKSLLNFNTKKKTNVCQKIATHFGRSVLDEIFTNSDLKYLIDENNLLKAKRWHIVNAGRNFNLLISVEHQIELLKKTLDDKTPYNNDASIVNNNESLRTNNDESLSIMYDELKYKSLTTSLPIPGNINDLYIITCDPKLDINENIKSQHIIEFEKNGLSEKSFPKICVEEYTIRSFEIKNIPDEPIHYAIKFKVTPIPGCRLKTVRLGEIATINIHRWKCTKYTAYKRYFVKSFLILYLNKIMEILYKDQASKYAIRSNTHYTSQDFSAQITETSKTIDNRTLKRYLIINWNQDQDNIWFTLSQDHRYPDSK